jgi:hypothetical protein
LYTVTGRVWPIRWQRLGENKEKRMQREQTKVVRRHHSGSTTKAQRHTSHVLFGLQVVEGVEVEIVHDANVGRRQIDPEAARLGRKQEDGDVVVAVELVHEGLALGDRGAPLHATVREPQRVHEAAQQVQAAGPHRKQQDAVALLDKIREQRAEALELGGREQVVLRQGVALKVVSAADRVLMQQFQGGQVDGKVAHHLQLLGDALKGAALALERPVPVKALGQVLLLGPGFVPRSKQQRVVRSLPELREQVAGRRLRRPDARLLVLQVVLEDGVVRDPRRRLELHELDLPGLRGEDLVQHVHLPPPQHKRGEQLLELAVRRRVRDPLLAFGRHEVTEHRRGGVIIVCVIVVGGKPLGKQGRHQEGKERQEFLGGVLCLAKEYVRDVWTWCT